MKLIRELKAEIEKLKAIILSDVVGRLQKHTPTDSTPACTLLTHCALNQPRPVHSSPLQYCMLHVSCVLCVFLQSLSEKLLGLTSENIHRKEEQVRWGGHTLYWTKGGPRVSSW